MAARPTSAAPSGASSEAAATAAEHHYRMCKKIAQLTKVIYHLNITNEDHGARETAMQRSHAEAQRLAGLQSEAQIKAVTDALEERTVAMTAANDRALQLEVAHAVAAAAARAALRAVEEQRG